MREQNHRAMAATPQKHCLILEIHMDQPTFIRFLLIIIEKRVSEKNVSPNFCSKWNGVNFRSQNFGRKISLSEKLSAFVIYEKVYGETRSAPATPS